VPRRRVSGGSLIGTRKSTPGANVKMEIVPPEQMYEKLDTRLAAGEGPDLARIQYQAIGRYSSQGALVELTDYLGEGYGDAFTPALWQSVLFEDKPYGLPQHTDTFALFYNQKIFDQLGVDVPGSPEEGWTWYRFMELARQVKEEGAAKYPFAMNWQGDGAAYRWMIYLFQRGDQLLSAPNITAERSASRSSRCPDRGERLMDVVSALVAYLQAPEAIHP
jgi:multiple sugar transport system substrate-binding protein